MGSSNGLLQIAIYFVTLIILAKPLGLYIARVFENQSCGLDFIFKPIERLIYWVGGVNSKQEMNWKTYALSVLFFSFFGFVFLYFIQRFQYFFPLNPQSLSAVRPDLAFNTAISYLTNTDWQAYSGETTLSYFSQTIGLTVQNFVSAATGMAVSVALIRGFSRHETANVGNFWVDLTRGILYILLPLASILAVVLVSQGVIQNYKPYAQIQLLQPVAGIHKQIIPMGPAASQVAIKQLGSNGGGFFAVNSAHPFENPTPLSNFLEMLALLLIPASLCFSFGAIVKDGKQGRAVFIVMSIIFLLFLFLEVKTEQAGNPLLNTINIDQTYGNMEGKETRFGVINSAIWATSTTASSNGSVNSEISSFMPVGGLIPMLLMQLDEVVFGGVGSGICGMLIFVVLTVFVAGLMIGRTPEYLGKKIEVFEMKMASLGMLIPLLSILVATALAVSNKAGTSCILNRGAHGFSEVLYIFSSVASNNGSSFFELTANNLFYNIATGVVMLLSRFSLIFSTLAIAGALACKKIVPYTKGTMLTHTWFFIGLTTSVVLVFGALAFIPALALGPVAEHLTMILGH
jgi:potassium-transporting ATPase potassium-binding subunit